MLDLAQDENQILLRVRRAASSRMSYIQFANPTERDIACVRIEMGNSILEGADRGVVRTYQSLLCKLLFNHPDFDNTFVFSDASVLLADSRIRRMYDRYTQKVSTTGYGSWRNMASEGVLYGIYQLARGYGVTAVSNAALQQLLSRYDRQAARAATAAASQQPQVTSDLPVSVAERKMAASEGRGKCFACDTPKPRGAACEVCGYIPQKARGE